MSTLLQYDRNVKKHQLYCQGFVLDDQSKMDDKTGAGFVKREKLITGSRMFELAGPLHLDFMQQGKDLLNLVNVRVKLTPNSDGFALLSGDTANYKIQIASAILYVRRVGIKSDILVDHEAKLRTEASYPVQRTEMLTYTIPTGSQSHTRDNLFRGLMPKFILMR